jgi:hypothetical protein
LIIFGAAEAVMGANAITTAATSRVRFLIRASYAANQYTVNAHKRGGSLESRDGRAFVVIIG